MRMNPVVLGLVLVAAYFSAPSEAVIGVDVRYAEHCFSSLHVCDKKRRPVGQGGRCMYKGRMGIVGVVGVCLRRYMVAEKAAVFPRNSDFRSTCPFSICVCL